MKITILFQVAVAAVRVLAVRSSELQPRVTKSTAWTVGQKVVTTSGTVIGHAADNQSDVSEYLGIPYAQPPIGKLRFAAPLNFTGKSTIEANAYGSSCISAAVNSKAGPGPLATVSANVTDAGTQFFTIFDTHLSKKDEDCLTLNVWTRPQTGEASKAVMVFIYGGGFKTGTSAVAGYNGANLVEEQDVIVVTFNYRLSILGFPGNPSGTNNVALLDQRLAIEWVRDNIANFGGDPTRIIIFGQSAGGASADLYSYAWSSDPIITGVIIESGTVFSWGLPTPAETAATAWFQVAGTMGCGDSSTDAATVLTCMQSKNATDLLNAVPVADGLQGILGPFNPTVDGSIVFSDYSQKTPAAIPILIGSNDYEAGLFRTRDAMSGLIKPDPLWDFFTLESFTCPAGLRANASLTAKNPTWRYRYMGVFPDTMISTEAGAFHSGELPIIFDTAPTVVATTSEENEIGPYMRGAWAAFAKTPTTGLTTYGWPTYDPASDTLIRLAYNNASGTNTMTPFTYDYDCAFVNVSSTDPDVYYALPPYPSGTSTSTSSPTGGASPSATKKSSAGRISYSMFAVAIGLIASFV